MEVEAGVTVLKLTQVGEENILRRSRKPSLRNSANCPRKFAIRGPSRYINLLMYAEGAVKWLWRLFIKNTVLC